MKHSQFEMENLSCPVVVKNTQSYTAWVSEYKTRQFKNFKFVWLRSKLNAISCYRIMET